MIKVSENKTDGFNAESIDLLLITAKSEYENEHSRTSIIDSKTSIALPIISAYFLALAQMNNFTEIFAIKIKNFSDLIIPSITLVTYAISLILAFVAVVEMVRVISTHKYQAIKPADLYDENYLKNEKIYLQFKLTQLYINASQCNKQENDSRVPLYKRGWQFTTISIVFFVIFVISKNYL